MFYYKIDICKMELDCEELEDQEDGSRCSGGRRRRNRRDTCYLSLEAASNACRTTRTVAGARTLFYARGEDDWAAFGLISPSALGSADVEDLFLECISIIEEEDPDWVLEGMNEVSFSEMHSMLEASEYNEIVASESILLSEHNIGGLDKIYDRFNRRDNKWLKETLIQTGATKEDFAGDCARFKCATIEDEIARIFDTSALLENFAGHPVHYALDSSQKSFCGECSDVLLRALYAAGRLESRRVTYIKLNDMDSDHCEAVLASAAGSTVLLDIESVERASAPRGRGSLFGRSKGSDLETFAETFRAVAPDTLLVLTFDTRNDRLRKQLSKAFPELPFVEIAPDSASGKEATDYLETLAQANGLAADEDLLGMIESDEKYFLLELDRLEKGWRRDKRLSGVKQAYADIAHMMTEEKADQDEKSTGSAKDELSALIGLDDIKDVIDQFVMATKAKAKFAELGREVDSMAMHLAFSGNPGTAKTTVARLLARILKEEGVLSRGHLVEVGRADLIGMYVGHTAPKVQHAFRCAKGGVLFIDEAYSLVDDRRGLFGDEAINTIVQEMENMRDEVVVIFAGYPEEMDGFVARNPGLRSRISHHVKFPDYDAGELMQIAQKITKEKGFILSAGARGVLADGFEGIAQERDFGNGRFVRNVIEQSIAKQAVRLMAQDSEKLGKRAVLMLTKDDIVIPAPKKKDKPRLGFVA